jgi:predicted metal-dependent phosphoesterase TrpH
MYPICDLHTHSTFSDGTYTPAQLIQEAEQLGLSAIALTDHNTIAGLPDFLAAAKNSPIEAVPGIEFSTEYRGIELHIVGLLIRPEHYDAITDMLHEASMRKEQSNIALIEALRDAGIYLDYARIRSAAPGQINRANIAAAMVSAGYCTSVKEAFSNYLNPKCGYYIPPERLDAFQVIGFLRSIGAVSILAHPFLNLKTEEALREFLTEAVHHGLEAMETMYTLFDAQTSRTLQHIAAEFGLKQSGGSDFHGDNKPGNLLGYGRVGLQVPLEFLNLMKNS